MNIFDRVAVRTEVLETIEAYYRAVKEKRVQNIVFGAFESWNGKAHKTLVVPMPSVHQEVAQDSYEVHQSVGYQRTNIYAIDFEKTLSHKENVIDKGFASVTLILKDGSMKRIDLTKLRRFLAGQIREGEFYYFG